VIIRTLKELWVNTSEAMPEKPPVLIFKPEGREYWRVWEAHFPKDTASCKYRLITRMGKDVD
jgi:hypothetical protein